MNIKSTLNSIYKPNYLKDFPMTDELKSIFALLFKMDDLNLLLVGEPNTGKTTFLYALVREYYGLQIQDNFPETNILFINNLKEQGIQFFRTEMKTFCKTRSNIFGKKKLIIVDDIDTINEQSQQIFRNYIDKYKQNVNFISICTNVQKIIESIQSRLHILKIPKLNDNHILDIINHITEKENIELDEETKQYLIKISNHSIRCVINYLEKINIYLLGSPKNSRKVSLEFCQKNCTNISFLLFEEYIDTILGNVRTCNKNPLIQPICVLNKIFEYGYSVIDIFTYFFNFVKITDKLTEEQKYKIIPIICKYTINFHNIHEEPIELTLFTGEICNVLM
jgi:DNA polymerase III delta prime subunit